MQSLRTKGLHARRSLSADFRAAASKIICQKVIRSQIFSAASLIACYMPMRDEVDTRFIIERGWCANKRVFVPVTRASGEMFFREIRPNTTLLRTNLSTWEPATGSVIPSRALQLVITPTVAFDHRNHRIGLGGGYYDRCFSFLRHRHHWFKPKLLGVAFECQAIEEISPNAWDVRLYRTFTEVR